MPVLLGYASQEYYGNVTDHCYDTPNDRPHAADGAAIEVRVNPFSSAASAGKLLLITLHTMPQSDVLLQTVRGSPDLVSNCWMLVLLQSERQCIRPSDGLHCRLDSPGLFFKQPLQFCCCLCSHKKPSHHADAGDCSHSATSVCTHWAGTAGVEASAAAHSLSAGDIAGDSRLCIHAPEIAALCVNGVQAWCHTDTLHPMTVMSSCSSKQAPVPAEWLCYDRNLAACQLQCPPAKCGS